VDSRLLSEQFPRANKYHPEWLVAGCSGGANPLWLTEWLTNSVDLRSGMRVLDLRMWTRSVFDISAEGIRSRGVGRRLVV
jgi:hypothetical protein